MMRARNSEPSLVGNGGTGARGSPPSGPRRSERQIQRTGFPRFGQLPPELRRLIWRFYWDADHEPVAHRLGKQHGRVYYTDGRYDYGEYSHQYERFGARSGITIFRYCDVPAALPEVLALWEVTDMRRALVGADLFRLRVQTLPLLPGNHMAEGGGDKHGGSSSHSEGNSGDSRNPGRDYVWWSPRTDVLCLEPPERSKGEDQFVSAWFPSLPYHWHDPDDNRRAREEVLERVTRLVLRVSVDFRLLGPGDHDALAHLGSSGTNREVSVFVSVPYASLLSALLWRGRLVSALQRKMMPHNPPDRRAWAAAWEPRLVLGRYIPFPDLLLAMGWMSEQGEVLVEGKEEAFHFIAKARKRAQSAVRQIADAVGRRRCWGPDLDSDGGGSSGSGSGRIRIEAVVELCESWFGSTRPNRFMYDD